MVALREADVDMDEEGPADTSKLVALSGPSSIGLAKGCRCRKLSIGLIMLKGLLLKVILMHGSRRSDTP
jgi:hypothetical protein